ncbi:MAG TPA: DUF4126 family protein [Thermomicrobiales bacterium]|nr:DUF4126 family protein [Thermomicrobiales bacterium]
MKKSLNGDHVSRALTLGIVAGLRSQMPMAALALRRGNAPASAGWREWPILRSKPGRIALVAAGAGETVGDKLPVTPSRLEPKALLGRIAFGGLAGAAIGSEARGTRPLLAAILLGAFGSVIGSFAGYHVRRKLGQWTGLPDPVVALGEDATAIALAAHATRLD